MSRLVCEGCGTGYDVSRREPGSRVRCPKCRTVLEVPERSGPQLPVTSSARLRRAQGAPCARHPRAIARSRCQRCRDAVCAACCAPEPVERYCARCAVELGLGGALPLDVGVATTYLQASSVFARSFLRILSWWLVATLAAFTLCALPIVVGALLVQGAESNVGQTFGQVIVAGSFVFGVVLHELVLLPAGCALVIDQVLRRQQVGFLETFRRTAARLLHNSGALLALLFVYALLAVLLLFPGVIGGFAAYQATDDPRAFFGVLLVEGALALLLLAATLGFAIPAVILEERPAFEALGRSWELARQRFGTVCAILVIYGAVQVGVGLVALKWPGFLLAGVSRVLDLFWPALLVTLYHGLVAEDARVLGRRSPSDPSWPATG